MPEVLALGLSPRKDGNSDLLLEEFLRGVRKAGAEARIFYPRKMKIEHCIECGGCDEKGECVFQDQMQEAYPFLVKTSHVVVSCPVFFYGAPSIGKVFIDRCQALWNRTRIFPDLRRPGGKGFLLGVGATKGRNLFDGLFLMQQYFQDAIGLPRNFDYLVYRRVEAKGEIRTHPTAFSEAFEAGKKFVS